ncbi:MAG: lytic transglycosylase domain-containing protein [Synergistaceae bacterium]|nr:lytic transglycosylase domain-containing protein [Synergistaceae bacterium]
MKILLRKTSFIMITLFAAAVVLVFPFRADSSVIDDAFWARDWKTMDSVYSASVSGDAVLETPALSPREKSVYANGLWLQGRYSESVAILESIQQILPEHLRAYAYMLSILGAERTDRKQDAFEHGLALWNSGPPDAVKYYLAYAMARLSRDLEYKDETVLWYRRMYELAPDKKREAEALAEIMNLGGANAGDAAAMLLDSPADARALAVLAAGAAERAGGLISYALGYIAYTNKKYGDAMKHFDAASADVKYGEAARYHGAYSAYYLKKDDDAYNLWKNIAMSGFDYPQRSVRALETLSRRSKKNDVIKLFGEIAARRAEDYPDVAIDALASTMRIGGAKEAKAAEEKLFTSHASSAQAATIRWERGWASWKGKKYRAAYDQWSAGYSAGIPNAELASRLLYWQSRSLEKLNSPKAAERVRNELLSNWPGEYYAFLVSPDGGIRQESVPEKFAVSSDLAEWGFVSYAKLEGTNILPAAATSADVPALYRSARLSLWDGEFAPAARMFTTMQRTLPRNEFAASELLKLAYPRAFEDTVLAASEKTGVAPEIIWGVMRQESMYQPDVTSRAGAYGLMQLMPGTAKGEARKMAVSDDAYLNPADNIMLGANHLAGLFARYDEAPLAFAAYNAGGGRVNKWAQNPITDMAEWIEDIPFRETRGYVKAVTRNIEAYKTLYPKEEKKEAEAK